MRRSRAYQLAHEPESLVRITPSGSRGDGPLFNHLHRIFAGSYGTTLLHRFLASLPRRLEEAGLGHRCQLIMTTNYDDSLERARLRPIVLAYLR